MIKKLSILLTSLLLTFSQLVWILPAQALSSPLVTFTEVKLGGTIAGQPTEFIELYNNANDPIVFDSGDWWLEYAKPTAVIADCSITSWQSMDSVNVKQLKVTGTIPAHGYMTINFSLNDAVGGAVRVQHSGIIDDIVAWGNTSSPPPCSQGLPASIPPNGKSIQRRSTTGQNATDFTEPRDPTPLAATATGPTPIPEPSCQGVTLSEIVPNPEGSDTDSEFIELFNETNITVNLSECILEVSASRQTLSGTIEPGYKAIYGISLPNATGAEVTLTTSDAVVSVTYPVDMGDDESYSLINGVWQHGALATPGLPNAMPVVDTSQVDSIDDLLVPCVAGKYRSPETNRCRNVETDSGPTACAPGQVRNLDTNRCRNITAANSALTPCNAGETRSPETNRCRKNTASTSTQTACRPGQERNPETNRCRKVAAAKTTNPLTNPATAAKKPVSYYVLGIVAALAAAYGIFEYRVQIRDLFTKHRKTPPAVV